MKVIAESPDQRIALLDTLRRAAVLGIFFVNIVYFVGQTVFAVVFFFGFGLARFGTLERYELALVCVAVWLVQILFSLWWLQHFRHGPLEWVWRAATRWELIPFRLARGSGSLAADHERSGA